jgi:ATP synthase F1 epsilon subunit
MHVQVLTQRKKILELDKVVSINVPTIKGDIQILQGHQSLIANLEPGKIKLQIEDKNDKETVIVRSGVLNIHKDKVVILADEAIDVKSLIKEEVEEAIRLAEDKLSTPNISQSELIALEKILRYEKFKLNELR